jgi:putrescine transport system substrate-binding protein
MVPFYIDNLAIPADSPNPAAALAFINFVMQPEISASVTRFIGFATGNAAALCRFSSPRFATTRSSIRRPQFAIDSSCRAFTARKITRAFTRAWTVFKSGL